MEEHLTGRIHSVIYSNEETGYAVFRVETTDAEIITAVGCLPFIAPGEEIEAAGRYVNHPSHGNQFSVEVVRRTLPSSKAGILEYLSSGVVKGVGKVTAKLLTDTFGDETMDILESQPQRLAGVRGLTPKKAKRISEDFAKQTGLRRLTDYLALRGIAPGVAVKLVGRYGAGAMERVRENPYILADEYYGLPFSDVDTIALSDGVDPDSPERCQAAVLFELVFNLNTGHAYIPKTKLTDVCTGLIGAPPESIEAAYLILREKEKIILDNDNCYLSYVFEAEAFVAQAVSALCPPPPDFDGDIDKLIAKIEESQGIEYAKAQRKAVALAAQNNILLLTGGPGTGKTTTVRAMLELYDELRMDVMLAAPTGRAAKRLSELTGREAKTIHRLLEFGFDPVSGEMGFMRDDKNPLKTDVIVIDETSMLDILLMYRLMLALPPGARAVFVGDPDQLPSVGPGNVLEDMLSCGNVPSVKLTEIFRQARQSKIVMSAHSVNSGELPSLKNGEGDMFFIRKKSPRDVLETIVSLSAERLPKGLGLDHSQIQVLSPSRKGPGGTINLNKALQNALNPPQAHKLEKWFGETLFREGDRVMQIKNDYDMIWVQPDGNKGAGIFNGEVGSVKKISFKDELITIEFDDKTAQYPFDKIIHLEPAFAMTVHKAQGSEYPAVIMVVAGAPEPLMTRRILYTAMTRARDWLILVGDELVIAKMVNNSKRGRRYSGLKSRLENIARP